MEKLLIEGKKVNIRNISTDDLPQIFGYEYSVSISEPLGSLESLTETYVKTNFWQEESGAVAIVCNQTDRLLGTMQFYRSAPCIHGFEIGYIIHNPDDRGKGLTVDIVQLFSNYLFKMRPLHFRQQLLIEVWNVPSWKTAERNGFVREGILRSCGFGQGDPADCFIYSRTRKDYSQALDSKTGTNQNI